MNNHFSPSVIINICSVLFPDCDSGWYGAGCIENCHCAEDVPCDPVSGICPTGCSQGYDGPTCSVATAVQTEDYQGKMWVYPYIVLVFSLVE